MMGDESRWQRIRRILEEALDLPAEGRQPFVRARCAEAGVDESDVLSLLALAGLGVTGESNPVELARFLSDHRLVSRAVEHLTSRESPASSRRVDAEIARLQLHERATERYTEAEEIGRGGMGAVNRVRDTHLQRDVAMKVLLSRSANGTSSKSGPDASPDTSLLARFLDEAWISGQLEHPGIVPVHDLGIDHEGRVWFTMRLVRGSTLSEVFLQHHADPSSCPLPRIVNLLLKACEAIAFAHAKGVVHRDLKPSNIMVGRFGEVYVMDWGLAKAKDRPDHRDLRLQAKTPKLSSLKSLRKADLAVTPDSPLVTMDGAVVGTPAYMAPEQAKGLVDQVGVQSDVYAMGAILYELVTGQMPYVEPGARVSPHTILAMVIAGPPVDPDRIAPEVPSELAAISRKAMARDPRARYRDMLEMSEDLRAFLEQRVVSAYRTGALAELRSWVRRNRIAAISAAAAITIAIAGSFAVSVVQTRAREESEKNLAEIRRLSDVKLLADLRRRAESIGPDLPAGIETLRAWIGEARLLVSRLPVHREQLREVERRALAVSPSRSHDQLSRATLSGPDSGSNPSTSVERLEFATPADGWQFATLQDLVAGLEAFAAPFTPDRAGPNHSTLAWIEKRLAEAEQVENSTITQHIDAWSALRAELSDPRTADPYRAMDLAPQVGLVPLGRDPNSRLHEFAHPRTGSIPKRDSAGALIRSSATGLVFVLIPGGEFTMGAHPSGETHPSGSPNVDPNAKAGSPETPAHTVRLDPFFISKYEMTQEQWSRLTGRSPSLYAAAEHPVEMVSHTDGRIELARIGLDLPTESQWEYAARAGTTTVYIGGDDPSSLQGFANIADRFAHENGGPSGWDYYLAHNDGHVVHAPVGSFAANAFGLHDVIGNVWEWCLDEFLDYGLTPLPGTGLRQASGSVENVVRGGGHLNGWIYARSAYRNHNPPDKRSSALGIRPARHVDS